MKAIDKIKDSEEVKLPIGKVMEVVLEDELDRFNAFCLSFGGSSKVEGLRLYSAFNALIINGAKFKELSLMSKDLNLMEHIEDGWELDIFEESCFDTDWYLELFTRHDSDQVVRFANNWDTDDLYMIDLLEYWCCDEAGKTAIDMYGYEEIDFETCKGVVQRCRIVGNLNLKVWLDKFGSFCEDRGDDPGDTWWKLYGYQKV
jgi:hypothetical protein